jgi:hypothetical protein
MLSTVLEVLGLATLVAAAALVSPALALTVAGASLLVVGLFMEPR